MNGSMIDHERASIEKLADIEREPGTFTFKCAPDANGAAHLRGTFVTRRAD